MVKTILSGITAAMALDAAEPDETEDAYQALSKSKASRKEVFKYLFREAARQNVINQNDREKQHHIHDRLSALMRKVIHDTQENPKHLLLDMLVEATEPGERFEILLAMQNELRESEYAFIPYVREDSLIETLRALQDQRTASLATSILEKSITDYSAENLLQKLYLARLLGDSTVTNTIEGLLDSTVSTKMLLQTLFTFNARKASRLESLVQITRRSDWPSINPVYISLPGLLDMLNDFSTRQAAIDVLSRLLKNQLSEPSKTEPAAHAYDQLYFEKSEHTIMSKVTGKDELPPVEGLGSDWTNSAIALSELIAIGEAVKDTDWVAQLRPLLTQLLDKPGVILGLLASTLKKDNRGDYAKEVLVAQVLDSLSDDRLSSITIHDPRLVLALILMKFRSSKVISGSAERALRTIHIDSTDEANAAAVDPEASALWANQSRELNALTGALIDLIDQTSGRIDDMERVLASRSGLLSLSFVERLRGYATSPINDPFDRKALSETYSDIEEIFNMLQRELDEEPEAEKYHALLTFINYLSHSDEWEWNASPALLVKLIDDLENPLYAEAAGRQLGRAKLMGNPSIFRLAWVKLHFHLVTVVNQGKPEINSPAQIMAAALLPSILRREELLPILLGSENQYLVAWLLDHASNTYFEDPRTILWMSKNVKNPAIGLKAFNFVYDSKNEKELLNFQSVLKMRALSNSADVKNAEAELMHIWAEHLEPKESTMALSLLELAHPPHVYSDSTGQLIAAFRNSMKNPAVSPAASRMAQAIVSSDPSVRSEWIEGLLNMRVAARIENDSDRLQAIDGVLSSALRLSGARALLQNLMNTTIDPRIHIEAARLLGVKILPGLSNPLQSIISDLIPKTTEDRPPLNANSPAVPPNTVAGLPSRRDFWKRSQGPTSMPHSTVLNRAA